MVKAKNEGGPTRRVPLKRTIEKVVTYEEVEGQNGQKWRRRVFAEVRITSPNPFEWYANVPLGEPVPQELVPYLLPEEQS